MFNITGDKMIDDCLSDLRLERESLNRQLYEIEFDNKIKNIRDEIDKQIKLCLNDVKTIGDYDHNTILGLQIAKNIIDKHLNETDPDE